MPASRPLGPLSEEPPRPPRTPRDATAAGDVDVATTEGVRVGTGVGTAVGVVGTVGDTDGAAVAGRGVRVVEAVPSARRGRASHAEPSAGPWSASRRGGRQRC